jgi:hypothetical protein
MTTEANMVMRAKTGITASKPSLCTSMPLVDVVEHIESCDVAVIDEDETGCPRVLFDRILLNAAFDHMVWNFDAAMIGGGLA